MSRRLVAANDKVDFGTSATLNPAAVTLSCWVYVPTFTFIGSNVADAYVCGRNVAVPNGAYSIYLTDTSHVFYVITTLAGAGGASITGSATLSTNTWYNVILAFSNPNLTTFVNGVSDGTTTLAHSLAADATAHFQALDDFANPGVFNATIRVSRIGVWNTVLAAGEIAALAKGALPETIRQPNLIGNFPLFGLTSPEPDLSGNHNNGTLTGTALAADAPVMMSTPRWPQFNFVPVPQILMPQACL